MRLFILAVLALLSSGCNSVANALWKTQFQIMPLRFDSLKVLILSVLQWRIVAGVLCYVVSMLLFFYLLSNYRLSQVIPFLATTYIFNFLIAALFFHEPVNIWQISGILLIIGGVILSNLKW